MVVGAYFSVHSQELNCADPTKPIRSQGTREGPIFAGDDCWIGPKVTIMAGSVDGPRTVIASGAVVKGEFSAVSLQRFSATCPSERD